MDARADPTLPRPKSITRRALASCGAVAALLGTASPADAERRTSESRHDRTERYLISEINRVRGAHGLPHYSRSRALSRSADYHSWDMLHGNFFAHASSNGTPFEGRVRRYTRAARLGENLAWVPGVRRRGVVRRVVGMWMNSDSHRAALLATDFAKIGVARRTGTIGAARVTVFTADLATRR